MVNNESVQGNESGRDGRTDGWMDGTHSTACGESDLVRFPAGSYFQKRFLVTLLFSPTTSPVHEGIRMQKMGLALWEVFCSSVNN